MRAVEPVNMTRSEAERIGLRPGKTFDHFIINQTTGKIEEKRRGRVTGLYKNFFTAMIETRKGKEFKECFPYYLLRNSDKSERIYIRE